MSVPNTPRNTPRDVLPRLGNVLYWVGIVVGAIPYLFVMWVIAWDFLWNGNYTPQPDGITFLLLLGAWAVVCYAIGWSLRYILSGATDHPLNIYLNSSEKYKDFLEWVIGVGFVLWAWRMIADGVNWFNSGQAVIWFHKTFG